MIPVIRKGDPLHPYGGEVFSPCRGDIPSGRPELHGKPVACRHDPVRCNKHGPTWIIDGSRTATADGLWVALDGHRCDCGCQVVSTLTASAISLEVTS